MGLFQCQKCGCCENTALGCYWAATRADLFDWQGLEAYRGLRLCSACGPRLYCDGSLTGYGEWHGRFPRVYLPKHQFITNALGNLQHIATGSEDYRAFRLPKEAP